MKNNLPGEPGWVKSLLNMIELTVEDIVSRGYLTIGLMSTTGTRDQRLYRDPFEARGVKVVEVDDQALVHDLIYNPEYGIKS